MSGILSLKRAFSDFEVHLRVERNMAPKTISLYLADLERLAEFLASRPGLGASVAVDQITRAHLKKHLEHLQVDCGLSSRSLARHLSSIRGFFRFCLEQEWIKSNPAESFRSPKQMRRLPVYLVEDELRRLFAVPDQTKPGGIRDHAILVTLANTGLRVSELAGLTTDSVDVERGTLRVFGKGRKERLVPMNEAVKAVLSRWFDVRPISDSNRIFLTQRGKSLGIRSIQMMLKKHGLKAGIPSARLTPHKLRHTFATLLHMSDVDIIEIQALLGHSNISSTQIYTHTNAGRLRSAVDRLSRLGQSL
jgi:site-specific recombinase XerD